MVPSKFIKQFQRAPSGSFVAGAGWLGRSALIVCLCVILSSCAGGSTFSGKCVGVADGDTITVLRHGKGVRVRLFGIDCPERGQDFYRPAKTFTSERVYGKTVDVSVVDQDDYGRLVAWVSVDGKNLNKELVAAGLAWWYKRYAPQEKELAKLEKRAREKKIGIWSHPHPVPPWEFRRENH